MFYLDDDIRALANETCGRKSIPVLLLCPHIAENSLFLDLESLQCDYRTTSTSVDGDYFRKMAHLVRELTVDDPGVDQAVLTALGPTYVVGQSTDGPQVYGRRIVCITPKAPIFPHLPGWPTGSAVL